MARGMKIEELINGLPCQLLAGSATTEIAGITEDSRDIVPGALFVARPGLHADGRLFIAGAVAAGAAAVLTDPSAAPPDGVPVVVSGDVGRTAAALGERFYGSPSHRLALVGVTGTNGKTTTAHLVHHLLTGGDERCGLIGTVYVDDGLGQAAARLTTPAALDLSRSLRQMVDNGCRACVMEVSSHALHQGRTAALAFEGAIFTNLSGDHLDYHGSMESYVAAKAMLFDTIPASGWAVINLDDPAGPTMARRCRGTVIDCSLTGADATCSARIETQHLDGADAILRGPWGTLELRLPLVGRHNLANALQAAAAAHRLGVTAEQLGERLASCTPPPGRLEPVDAEQLGFAVLVDYAHTDDALDNVLGAIRQVMAESSSTGRLIVVFGCGGDRDRTKRPRMAAVACRHGDQVVITSDNPRTEDPQAIIDDVLPGVSPEQREHVLCMVDRAAAIRVAIERARPGDVVLIAGKGHEDYQIVGAERRHFDDREHAAAVIAARLEEARAR